ncbi:FAD-binding oxidoreductase [Wenzhouxiangella sp. AB-CW3]|uniref:NAD(P)/FAD-dependent oxidoreductase n=1 Tax=Wenzhouxiangella sp. AB-CW3 TaxID=2771012 RepID=UPI00168AD134|nr:FAD-binding oxidoreductase [Wenzhouxiangella sp. AB-CW3]QOC21629.1 FAD-binding oxidoreductase [Wenzhouxiangella sp. AB-CW3]
MKLLDHRWPGSTWYQATAPQPDFASVSGLHRYRVAIVGAGLAGLSTALGLIERGQRDVCVIDAAMPGAGASGRNGGFVFAGYSLDNEALVEQLGSTAARTLHGWTREAVSLMRHRADRHGIDCQINDAGVVLADWFGDDAVLSTMAKRWPDELGFGLDLLDRKALREQVCSHRYGCGLHEPGSFHFHPLRYLLGLAEVIENHGGAVLAHSPVRSIDREHGRWRLRCDHGQVEADEVVLTTGGYDRRLHRPVQRALQPVATYIAVTEPLGVRLQEVLPAPVAVYDTRFAFDYYRPLPDRRLLWGGRISMAARSPAAIRRLMARDLARVFPELRGVRLEYAWGGWMSYARHQMPLIGRQPNGLWYGLAFGGHGMATTTLSGEVLAEALTGDGGRLQAFSRWPPIWGGGPVGRAGIQGYYWYRQLLDALRERWLGRQHPL